MENGAGLCEDLDVGWQKLELERKKEKKETYGETKTYTIRMQNTHKKKYPFIIQIL